MTKKHANKPDANSSIEDASATNSTAQKNTSTSEVGSSAKTESSENVSETNNSDQSETGNTNASEENTFEENASNEELKSAPDAPAVDRKTLPKQLLVLAESIEKSFADREKTSLPKLTAKDVKQHTAHSAKGINLEFVYTNDEKTSGHIVLSEFNHTVRVPETGDFTFGIDYSGAQ